MGQSEPIKVGQPASATITPNSSYTTGPQSTSTASTTAGPPATTTTEPPTAAPPSKPPSTKKPADQPSVTSPKLTIVTTKSVTPPQPGRSEILSFVKVSFQISSFIVIILYIFLSVWESQIRHSFLGG